MFESNEINQKTTIPYAINGCFVLRPDQMDIINERILSRNQTDIPLAPSFDPRPVQTKYTRFGVLDEYKTTNTPIKPDQYKDWYYSNLNTKNKQPFTTSTANGPPLAYFMNLDKETALQRQGAYMFNSKDLNDDSVYQPSQKGDLYSISIAKYSGYGGSAKYSPTERTPYLFDEYSISSTRNIPFSSDIDVMPFNNPTLPRGTIN